MSRFIAILCRFYNYLARQWNKKKKLAIKILKTVFYKTLRKNCKYLCLLDKAYYTMSEYLGDKIWNCRM